MAKDLWLPKGFELSDGSKIRSLLYAGDEWQIFDTNGSNNILLTRPELARKWDEFGFLDRSLFGDVALGNESFQSLSSHKKYTLAAVENGKSPENKVDALAFAFALKESRKLSDDASFHDAVYVEQYSKLLPVWTLTPDVDDEVVLGTWITGGVVIATESFRRLTNLTGWMPAGDLAEIVKAAGFSVPADAGLLAKRKPASQTKSDAKLAFAKEAVESEQPKAPEVRAEVKFFKLPGRPQLEEFFNEHIIDIIFNAEKYRQLGIEFPSAVILHGPPGCGKTFAVERLVEFIDWPSYSIDSNSVGSPYIHETSKKISEVFDKAIDAAPSIIVIDEMESFLSDRRSGSSSGLHHVEEVAEFLRRIPEAIKKNVLIIAMTNLIEMIDPAILRRGRFDHIIEVGMPSREEVASLIDSLLSKLPKAADLKVDEILDELTGKALSDSAFVIREAARIAAKTGKSELDQESILTALNSLPKNQEKSSRRIGFVWDDK
ncbi:ATP-binding protein [Shewanella sp. SM20]|uniref:ATP-binding protein n=1 Tax=Shewanella TaxID=22 RepID=UPI0021DB5C70|nr:MULTISPECIES: ATP-binding protein [unclassified Shewanella]MCU8071365.1 ATP-binding protein [Shewanella sp. SM32]MCU8093577.1 ATP-binding protein [Shewanella sp. SM20]